MARHLYVCLLSFALATVAMATPSMAALQKVQFQEIEDVDALNKEYPFLKPVIDSVMSDVGEDGGIVSLRSAQTNLNGKKSFVFLQIDSPSYCGAIFGCATVVFLDKGAEEGANKAFGIQLPGDIYAGTCKDTPVMVAQLWEPGTQVERFRTFPLGLDGKLHFGQFFPTLNEVDPCAPIDKKADSQVLQQ